MKQNKYQEALDYFLDRDDGENVTVTCDWLLYAELLQELVEKETPLKPTNQVVIDFGLGNAGNCKACNREVNYQNKYCDNCGKKIDWSDEEWKNY